MTKINQDYRLFAIVSHGKRNGSKQFKMYRKELPEFEKVIKNKVPEAMWQELIDLFKE